MVEPGQLPGGLLRAAQRLQISLVFGWSSMFGSLAFASAGTEQGISYAARRWKHFGGGGSGSSSVGCIRPPHKWTTSPAAALAGACGKPHPSPHWGHGGAVSGSFRTSIELVGRGLINAQP